MSRATGSMEFHEVVYPIMLEEGPMSTGEIYDKVNNLEMHYRGGGYGKKTKRSWTMNQVAQTLRVSRFFRCVGEQREWGTHQRRTVKVYECVPVKEVIQKIVGKKHTIQDYSKTLPFFARKEYNEEMAKIDENFIPIKQTRIGVKEKET